MARWSLGVVLDALKLPTRAAVEKAASIGAACVQFDAVGPLTPDTLSTTGRREWKTILRSHGLALAAVQVPLRRGLDEPENQQARIDHVRKMMSFAFELGCGIVSLPMPRISESTVLMETLTALSTFSDHVGVRLALEAGLDSGTKVSEFLSAWPGVGVTYDPANFLANTTDAELAKLNVLHVQARDVRAGNLSRGPKEVAVGAGDVDWLMTFALLSEYAGAVVVDREDGPPGDVESGVKFLKRFAV